MNWDNDQGLGRGLRLRSKEAFPAVPSTALFDFDRTPTNTEKHEI
jgi:hypothetical protein